MKAPRNCHLSLAVVVLVGSAMLAPAQDTPAGEPVLQLCGEYSGAGDLVEARVTAHSFSVTISRPSGEILELASQPLDVVVAFPPLSSPVRCELAISSKSDHAALAIPDSNSIIVVLIDLTTAKLTHTIRVPHKFPIQFTLHPVGFINGSDQLAVSQAHYRPTGEPEIATQLVSADGTITSLPQNALGTQYTEVSSSSFDFRDGRVWFLCSAYSARIDRQPRCTLTSAALVEASTAPREIPAPPDDRVIGSGQPNLGFPSSGLAVILAEHRMWLYRFADRSFKQLNLPETPHHVRWFEFPGEPKFSSDERFAAVPVQMFHSPLFQEGQVSHGTKVVIVDLSTLTILKTIEPPKEENLVDFTLHADGGKVTLAVNWGKEWKNFQIPVAVDSR